MPEPKEDEVKPKRVQKKKVEEEPVEMEEQMDNPYFAGMSKAWQEFYTKISKAME